MDSDEDALERIAEIRQQLIALRAELDRLEAQLPQGPDELPDPRRRRFTVLPGGRTAIAVPVLALVRYRPRRGVLAASATAAAVGAVALTLATASPTHPGLAPPPAESAYIPLQGAPVPSAAAGSGASPSPSRTPSAPTPGARSSRSGVSNSPARAASPSSPASLPVSIPAPSMSAVQTTPPGTFAPGPTSTPCGLIVVSVQPVVKICLL